MGKGDLTNGDCMLPVKTDKDIIMEIDYRDENMKRIADALEEILRLVKEDQERSRKYMEEKKDD